MQYLARVYVTLKPTLLDAQGRAQRARFNPRSYCITAPRRLLNALTSFAVTQ